jgi:carbon-monoxide dehydrogenase iron sulfur subunit
LKILVVIPDRCVGCRRCELYCSFKFYKTHNPARSRIHVIRSEPYIDAPIICLQCGLCIDSCPSGAISRNMKTGAIVVNEEKCTGCGLCVPSCPIGMIKVDPVTNVAIKCDLCGGDPENPLFKLNNVVLSPHTATMTQEAMKNIGEIAAHSVNAREIYEEQSSYS